MFVNRRTITKQTANTASARKMARTDIELVGGLTKFETTSSEDLLNDDLSKYVFILMFFCIIGLHNKGVGGSRAGEKRYGLS